MSDQQSAPVPGRPTIEGYGVPENAEGMLPWSHVSQRMAASRNYWIATVRPDDRPHVVPVWGVWFDETLYFGGGPNTRWARNLKANPHISVHLEDGSEVVIIEGTVKPVEDMTLQDRIDDHYEEKYNMRHGPYCWQLKPRVAFGWTEYPKSVTRWTFE